MDTVRSFLQPITHNLPAPIRDLGVSMVGEKCYGSILLDLNLEDVECLKLGVSKGLGISIVGASSIVKLPQIIKLINSQSAAGISFLSYLLETSSFLISLAYNYRNGFPFSTYGETALILIQNVVVTGLILQYAAPKGTAAVFVAGVAAATYALYSDAVVPMGALAYFQAGAGVLGVASKVPQIAAIWREGSTGQLSAVTVFSFLVGSLSRIFTTIQEVDDILILCGFIAGFVLNLVLAAQMGYYWNAPSKKALGKKPMPIVEPEGFSVAPSTGVSSSSSPTRRATPSAAPSTRRRG
ncbi:uncharacterized protein MKZ38_000574 [Zalerion maritima]|uniref:Mannose-P-dolichol utilization defect 1 protein homolog n=1 Tax=Zalerion maritima TaxID=339359 RepID=A0AAD5WUG7_9PEZI|nr:uncharacterized protein MKZ38_000574 [Zalerion maritima]